MKSKQVPRRSRVAIQEVPVAVDVGVAENIFRASPRHVIVRSPGSAANTNPTRTSPMKRLALAAGIAAASILPAHADVMLGGQLWTGTGNTLTLSTAQPPGNQPLNAPCLICGASQPQQPSGFGYNDFSNGGNITNITAFSDQGNGGRNTLLDNTFNNTSTGGYQIGDGSLFKAFLLANGDTNANLAFSIGIDVNDASQPQTLNSFFFLDLTTHTVLGAYVCTAADCTVPSFHNGTGFPDYTLSGLSLNGVNAGDEIIFAARMTGLNDGPDSFFLEPQVVPSPVVGAGLPGLLAGCLALVGLGRLRRKRDHLKI
jgi:hypothetical protein